MIEASQALFSLETLIITVSAGAVAALVVGFVTGYCCGRRCHKDDNTLVSIGLYFICKQSTPFENPQRWMGQNTFPILLLDDDNMIEEH